MDKTHIVSRKPKIGAHVSAAISLDLSFDRAEKIGAECTQIFISPPQQWVHTQHDTDEIRAYQQSQTQTGIWPNFIHATYLINLASQNPELVKKSVDWLVYAMSFAVKLGTKGVIFHIGSHTGSGFETSKDRVCRSISHVFGNLPSSNTKLILENSAGMGGSIGSKFSELGQILKVIRDDRLRICLDTQHSFAAGYDVKTPIGLRTTLEELDKEIGLKNLAVIHANDSKVELGRGLDRHENIGEGFIGREGFENIINHPVFKDIPFILEVPGFGNIGTDKENINLLKSLTKI